MRNIKLPFLAVGGAFSLLLASCSNDLKDSDYPESALKTLPPASAATSVPEIAYKDILWSDSIPKLEASLKERYWTGDPFGVYTRAQIMNSVLLDIYNKSNPRLENGEKPTEKQAREESKKLLSKYEQDNFIIKKISFQSGKSDVTLYWFEMNDPYRQSRFVDKIVWSKMCMVRVFHYDPPVLFDKVLEAEKTRFGEPATKAFKESEVWDWYKKQVEPRVSYHPEKEYLWRKDGLTVILYNWKNQEEKSGRSELTIRNETVFQEFEAKIRERIAFLSKEKEKKTEESAKQALTY